MKNSNNYHDETAKENILQLRKLQEELPRFCRQYFRGIEQTTAPRTRLAYAYDLGVFFEFLHKNNSVLSKMDIIVSAVSSGSDHKGGYRGISGISFVLCQRRRYGIYQR